jgi:putative membrane protein insertion efficiency factor
MKQLREVRLLHLFTYWIIPGLLIPATVVADACIFRYTTPSTVVKTIIIVTSVLLLYLLLRRFAVGTVLAYKAFAPLSMRGECRFQPSCSTYMIMAINRYGLVIGITKGIRRILRCKPPNGGVDYP